jgi:hypothetical protein
VHATALQLLPCTTLCVPHSLTVLHRRYTAKFSVRPPHENVDVNLTVAWWGSARGNSV